MSKAIELAKVAYSNDEVPVGAIVVRNNKNIGCGYNKKDYTKNPLNHAELLAIEEACKYIGDWRLNDCELYTTLEPCMMCMGAIINSRIKKIYIGTLDPKTGACESVINIENYKFNHVVEIETGILQKECEYILKDFFKMLRNKKRRKK